MVRTAPAHNPHILYDCSINVGVDKQQVRYVFFAKKLFPILPSQSFLLLSSPTPLCAAFLLRLYLSAVFCFSYCYICWDCVRFQARADAYSAPPPCLGPTTARCVVAFYLSIAYDTASVPCPFACSFPASE